MLVADQRWKCIEIAILTFAQLDFPAFALNLFENARVQPNTK